MFGIDIEQVILCNENTVEDGIEEHNNIYEIVERAEKG
jgi:hypothetical protein